MGLIYILCLQPPGLLLVLSPSDLYTHAHAAARYTIVLCAVIVLTYAERVLST